MKMKMKICPQKRWKNLRFQHNTITKTAAPNSHSRRSRSYLFTANLPKYGGTIILSYIEIYQKTGRCFWAPIISKSGNIVLSMTGV